MNAPRNQPRFSEANLQKNVEVTSKITAMAEKKGCTPGQLALAWVQSRGPDVFPIPGTKSRTRLGENAKACEVKLTAEECAELEAAVPHDQIVGERYAPDGQSMTFGSVSNAEAQYSGQTLYTGL